jgi:hypothetical protein
LIRGRRIIGANHSVTHVSTVGYTGSGASVAEVFPPPAPFELLRGVALMVTVSVLAGLSVTPQT